MDRPTDHPPEPRERFPFPRGLRAVIPTVIAVFTAQFPISATTPAAGPASTSSPVLAARNPAAASSRPLVLEPRFGAIPIQIDQPIQAEPNGPTLTVTRLDLLVSGLQAPSPGIDRTNAPADGVAFFSLGARRLHASVQVPVAPGNAAAEPAAPPSAIPPLEFHVGLPPILNHADPASFAPDHPLHPSVNGLHWSWQGGYVFLALEGYWQATALVTSTPPARRQAFSFHLATDARLSTIRLPWPTPAGPAAAAAPAQPLRFQLDRLFNETIRRELAAGATSTHSRSGDPVADALTAALPQAFSLDPAQPATGGNSPTIAPSPESRRVALIAKTATPYRFSYPKYFPRPDLPTDNPLTEEGVALGRALFHDPRLSAGQKLSCANCHHPDAGFVDPGRRFSRGVDGLDGARNAMPLFNLAWKKSFFWDGRASTLREQVIQPIENPIEMHASLPNVVRQLQTAADIAAFDRAFGPGGVTADRLARALEQFLLTLTATRSRFDRMLAGLESFTAEEQRGFDLFHTEQDPRRGQFGADCFHCHGGPLFQSQAFANNGLDADAGRDPGRAAITGRPADRGRFATPSLRNVALTAPYMHDGRFATLEAVVAHYCNGIQPAPTLDPNLAKHPRGGLNLGAEDQRALVAFLQTLTDTTPSPPAANRPPAPAATP